MRKVYAAILIFSAILFIKGYTLYAASAGRPLGLAIMGAYIAFPVGFALYWLYVSLLPGIFPNLWPMWIGVAVTIGVCIQMVRQKRL